MTTSKDVEKVLSEMRDNTIAQLWLKNDIVKMQLAVSYDECSDDLDGDYMSLYDHVEYHIDNAKELNMPVK
ncbi:hypothetical protein BKP37_12660 [Anaerobacillus alkalilacustris]|uniref:Uncharacterized protein n=1 Tax=Anaerobacillus alkalilacustris TaxID=393763 RepID=A0A1S2LJE1_9BACI|nr:hypothetical protein [Anaerobacillus alkalilacustris]OIJ12649.1 hypothetical protein BKP37_12660 [Anaerobacillus alkalilacustris]